LATVRELEKIAIASKNHAEKFSQKTKAAGQEMVEDWKAHQEKM